MKKSYCFAVLMLIMGCLVFNAGAISETENATAMDYAKAGIERSQDADQVALPSSEVALSLYILERKGNGTLLSGVAVTAYDAAGNISRGLTTSTEPLVIKGQPGSWQFSLAKEGYTTMSLVYNITKTSTAIASVDRIGRSPVLVLLTIDVHDGALNGTDLAGVQVIGQDAAGGGFEEMTDSDGSVTIDGLPGTWQFTFSKEGYETLSLRYNVTETEETAAYLLKAEKSQENPASP